MEIPLKY